MPCALESGDAFDWCPDLFGGFYLTGEGQVGTYHPLHWLAVSHAAACAGMEHRMSGELSIDVRRHVAPAAPAAD